MLGLAGSGPENDEMEVEREANEEDSANSSGTEVRVNTAAGNKIAFTSRRQDHITVVKEYRT
jgi:hypothetical protein